MIDKNEKQKPKITREEYDKVKEEYTNDKDKPKKGEDKKVFRKIFPWGKRRKLNKSLKKPDLIVVFLINLKKQLEGPICTKIYGGNFLVIRNHVYRFNPERVFAFGKYKSVIAREFDRELVGIEDYQKIVLEDYTSKNPGSRINIDDPVLIKALINAHLSEKQSMGGNMKWIIIACVIIGLAIGAFFLFGGKKAPVQSPNVPG